MGGWQLLHDLRISTSGHNLTLSLLTLRVEGSTLHQRLPVTNTPTVEVLTEEVRVPVDVSGAERG